jgi:hypothetical protein
MMDGAVAQSQTEDREQGGNHMTLDPYDVLIAGQWANAIRLLQQVGELYFQTDFKLGPSPTDWFLALGWHQEKKGRYTKRRAGYWIFRTDVKLSWMAVGANGPLRYWNEDGQARGNPENWELFAFEAVNRPERVVRIKNAWSGAYITLRGDVFSCQGQQNEAALFYVDFPNVQPAFRFDANRPVPANRRDEDIEDPPEDRDWRRGGIR